MRSARYAALATLDPLDGSPSVSRVSLATAMDGSPIFLDVEAFKPLHKSNGGRSVPLLVGEPGKGDPLAHPRMTLTGKSRANAVSTGAHLCSKSIPRRHPKAALYADFPDFSFWRFATARASLNGGFGKAYALTTDDIASPREAIDALSELEEDAIVHMNTHHVSAIERYAVRAGEEPIGWSISTLDPEGFDLTSGDRVARLWFDKPLASAAELRPALTSLAKDPIG